MNEKNTNTVLEALAETIEKLKSDNYWLDRENKSLKEKIAKYESPCQEVSNGKL